MDEKGGEKEENKKKKEDITWMAVEGVWTLQKISKMQQCPYWVGNDCRRGDSHYSDSFIRYEFDSLFSFGEAMQQIEALPSYYATPHDILGRLPSACLYASFSLPDEKGDRTAAFYLMRAQFEGHEFYIFAPRFDQEDWVWNIVVLIFDDDGSMDKSEQRKWVLRLKSTLTEFVHASDREALKREEPIRSPGTERELAGSLHARPLPFEFWVKLSDQKEQVPTVITCGPVWSDSKAWLEQYVENAIQQSRPRDQWVIRKLNIDSDETTISVEVMPRSSAAEILRTSCGPCGSTEHNVYECPLRWCHECKNNRHWTKQCPECSYCNTRGDHSLSSCKRKLFADHVASLDSRNELTFLLSLVSDRLKSLDASDDQKSVLPPLFLPPIARLVVLLERAGIPFELRRGEEFLYIDDPTQLPDNFTADDRALLRPGRRPRNARSVVSDP